MLSPFYFTTQRKRIIMNLLSRKNLLIYNYNHSLLEHLEVDKKLVTYCETNTLITRFWMSDGVVLGKLDKTLSGFDEGIKFLKDNKLDYGIRKSGGLAVYLDSGVLNISFIFNNNRCTLLEGYEIVVELLKNFLKCYHIVFDVGEISDSYCPGKYDLSVSKRKFCGMAQFRSSETSVVMITLFVSGDQRKRSRIINEFYINSNYEKSKMFPQINADSMITLNELTEFNLNPDKIKKDFIEYLVYHYKNVSYAHKLDQQDLIFQ